MMGMMADCMAGWGMGMGMFGMMGLMLAFWAGVVLLIVALVRRLGRGGQALAAPRGVTEDRALAALRERYGRGEIDRAEYEERRRTLLDEGAGWP